MSESCSEHSTYRAGCPGCRAKSRDEQRRRQADRRDRRTDPATSKKDRSPEESDRARVLVDALKAAPAEEQAKWATRVLEGHAGPWAHRSEGEAMERLRQLSDWQDRVRRAVACVVILLLGAGTMAVATHRRDVGSVFTQDDLALEPATGECDRRPPADRGADALKLIRYPWADLGYEVVFMGPRKGYLAITSTGRHRVEVYVRACQSVTAIASVLGHEFGHVVDDHYMSPAERGEYMAIRGISGSWFGCNRCSDYATPAGDFAEVFGYLKAPAGPFRSKLAPPPSARQAAELERFYFPDSTPPPLLSTTVAPTIPAASTTGVCHVAVGTTCVVP